MINAEKYNSELKALLYKPVAVDADTNEPYECKSRKREECHKCLFRDKGCLDAFHEWLLEEHKEKIRLTKFEYLILNNLRKKWKYIARDADRNLYIYENAPSKDLSYYGRWRSIGDFIRLNNAFGKDCFSSIKWEDEKSRKIQDILENCEVIEE